MTFFSFLQVLVHEDAIFAQSVLARRPPQIAGVPMIRYKRARISHRHHFLTILALEGIPWSTFDFSTLAVAFVVDWEIDVNVAACGHLDQRFFETDRNFVENSRLTPDFRYRRGTPITAPYLGKSAIPRPKMPSTPSHMRRGPLFSLCIISCMSHVAIFSPRQPSIAHDRTARSPGFGFHMTSTIHFP